MSNDFKYSGIPKELDRKIGNASSPNAVARSGAADSTMRSLLLATLDEIQVISLENTANFSEAMRDVAVVVPEHSALNKAKEQEWPSDLGTAKGTIGYDFYSAMDKKNTSGSTFLQSHYRENVLKSRYAAFFNINEINQIMFDESKRIEDFVYNYMGDSVGSEKTATFRLLQEWADYALEVARNFRGIESQKDQEMLSSIPTTNMDKVSPEESKQLQAFFQGKINSINTVISSDLESVKKSHGYLSDRFFNDHLGPALTVRSSVVSKLEKIQPSIGSGVAEDVRKSANVYDSNLKVALSDQIIRNRVFKDRVDNALKHIGIRDGYIDTIDKLSLVGSPTTPQIVKEAPTKEEVDYFQSFQGTDEDIFKASHAHLDDVGDPTAHPQYILKDGDEITGNLSLAEGVKVDGVVISKHKHDGLDGSEKIDATDLVDGSLEIASINTNEAVVKPEGLKFVASKTMLNASTALMDATFEWEGERSNSFEIQIAPVIDYEPGSINPVFRIINPAPGDSVAEAPFPDAPILKTADGDTWFFFLSQDTNVDSIADFNSKGSKNVTTPTTLNLSIASSATDSALEYDTVADGDFTTDVRMTHPYRKSDMWVLRAGGVSASYYDEDIIMCVGNKVLLVMGETETPTPTFSISSTLKEFDVDELSSADIYAMAIDPSDNTVYFFVKLSTYDETMLEALTTTIELWTISQSNELTKIHAWHGEEELDKKINDIYGWYTEDINNKDYALVNVNTVVDGIIYGFCLYMIPGADGVVPVLCKLDLDTMEREVISLNGVDFYAGSTGDEYTSPQPVIVNDVIYLPGTVLTQSEEAAYVDITNSIVTINDSVHQRHYLKVNNGAVSKVNFVQIQTDSSDNIYVVGMDILSAHDTDTEDGAIYELGSLDG